MGDAAPTVSIIMATYNRGNILRYSIGSVLNQTFSDWELLIIGDACTDDTAAVVASFADPRISFTNLERNSGEQSGPNNEGLRRSRGRYVAILNHDDLWFPWHLDELVHALESRQADLVFGGALSLQPSGPAIPMGMDVGHSYHRSICIPASLWLFRRELIDRIGPWRMTSEIYNVPSQDWLARAYGNGAIIRAAGRITVVLIASNVRDNSYRNRDEEEHRETARRLENPRQFLVEEGERIVLEAAYRRYDTRIVPALKNLIKSVMYRIFTLIGRSSTSFTNFLRHGRKGGLVRHYRKIRGLDKNRGSSNE